VRPVGYIISPPNDLFDVKLFNAPRRSRSSSLQRDTKKAAENLAADGMISPRGVMAETRHSPSGERHEKLSNSDGTKQRTCSRFRDLCTEESLEIARRLNPAAMVGPRKFVIPR
jgi:hypothetical protein